MTYQGEFKSELKCGIGMDYDEENGELTYEGEFMDNKRCGLGKVIFGGPSRYSGEWKNGMRHGYVNIIFFLFKFS